MQNKVQNMIYFAIRAHKYCLGETVLEKIRKNHSVRLVLIANDASLLTKKKYTDKLTFYKTKYLFYSTKGELGNLLHKEEISVFGIEDVNISNQVINLIEEGD